MNCPKCHKQIAENSSICPFCGTVISDGGKKTATLPKLKALTPLNVNEPVANKESNTKEVPVTPPSLETLKVLQPLQQEQKPQNQKDVSDSSTEVNHESQTPKAPVNILKTQAPSVTEKIETFSPTTTPSETTDSKKTLKSEKNAKKEKKPKEPKKKSLIGSIFKKKEKERQNVDASSQNIEDESIKYDQEELYNTNLDGYYDDLIPELAKQINKIPQENVIKFIFFVIGIIVIGGMLTFVMINT